MTWALILIHLIDIAIWALFFLCRVSAGRRSAFLFLGSHLWTVGYGDVVCRSRWRLLGPLEGLRLPDVRVSPDSFRGLQRILGARLKSILSENR